MNKKLLGIYIFAALVFGTGTYSLGNARGIASATPTSTPNRLDVNGDTRVDVNDIADLVRVTSQDTLIVVQLPEGKRSVDVASVQLGFNDASIIQMTKPAQ